VIRLCREQGAAFAALAVCLWRGSECSDTRSRYGYVMMSQPAAAPEPAEPYQVIELGGQEAAIVPLPDLRRLQSVAQRAPAELVEQAEIETTLAAHRAWVAAGRPGAVSHDRAMEELLTEP
jgi:hypothetical protein